MKKILLIVFLFFTLDCFAQNCNGYYFFRNNKVIEMRSFDAGGKTTGKMEYLVANFSGGASSSKATINSKIFDNDGKLIATSTNHIKCNNGVLMMDMKMNLPQQEQFSKATATAEDVYFEYPASMSVGDKLKDGSMSLKVSMNGMEQDMDIDILNRKVVAKENVTTPAGSWMCFKITYMHKVTVKVMGMEMPMSSENTEWFAPSFGVVKSIGKHGGTELTAIK